MQKLTREYFAIIIERASFFVSGNRYPGLIKLEADLSRSGIEMGQFDSRDEATAFLVKKGFGAGPPDMYSKLIEDFDPSKIDPSLTITSCTAYLNVSLRQRVKISETIRDIFFQFPG